MRHAENLLFVKTHRPRDDQVHESDRAICLVRDGRDALVSWARQTTEDSRGSFESALRTRIDEPQQAGAGSWGTNILSWLIPPAVRRPVLRYENLIADPAATVGSIMSSLAPHLLPIENAHVPSFAELHQIDAQFFRRGHTGTHRDEMPNGLHQLFWSRPDNIAAMTLLGHGHHRADAGHDHSPQATAPSVPCIDRDAGALNLNRPVDKCGEADHPT